MALALKGLAPFSFQMRAAPGRASGLVDSPKQLSPERQRTGILSQALVEARLRAHAYRFESRLRDTAASMFKVLGAVLALYVCYCVFNGRVVAKAGAGSREVLRDEAPLYFWMVVAIYAGLSLALFTVF